jgi:hypothetical protein
MGVIYCRRIFVEMFRFGITNTGLIRYLSGADNATKLNLSVLMR